MTKGEGELPVRIQRKRTKGWRMPPGCVCVTRPSRFSNPLRVGMWRGYTAADAVRDYRKWIDQELSHRSYNNAFGKPPTIEEIRAALGGKDLACFCAVADPCHADVLLELANPKGEGDE